MSVQVTIRERGAGQAAFHLYELGARAEFAEPAWEAMNVIFRADEERRFALQGPGWKPLSDETVLKKGSTRIMVDTGTLKRSLTTGATGDKTGGKLGFGTDVEYARFHQYGTVKMPRREVVGISPGARRAMVAVLQRWIAHGAGL